MKKLIFLLVLSLFMSASAEHGHDIPRGYYSVKAYVPDSSELSFYIGHYRYGGKLLPLDSQRNAIDSTFEIVPGLAGQSGTVSFRAVTPKYEDYYLVHRDFRIVLAKKKNNSAFAEHATFWVEASNLNPKKRMEVTQGSLKQIHRTEANRGRGATVGGNYPRVSFRSYNFPSYFIRHHEFGLMIAVGKNDRTFKEETSFIVDESNKGFFVR